MTETIDPNYAGDGIYRENIMDHFKNPRNFGTVENPDIKHRELNPLCGDEVEITAKVENGKVTEIKFSGNGCAISKSATSMLLETLKGKTIEELKSISRDNILDLLAIPIGPVRVKCAMLSLDTLKNGIHIYENYGGKK
jgi:nitrogen fixation protein NifU and related proteins